MAQTPRSLYGGARGGLESKVHAHIRSQLKHTSEPLSTKELMRIIKDLLEELRASRKGAAPGGTHGRKGANAYRSKRSGNERLPGFNLTSDGFRETPHPAYMPYERLPRGTAPIDAAEYLRADFGRLNLGEDNDIVMGSGWWDNFKQSVSNVAAKVKNEFVNPDSVLRQTAQKANNELTNPDSVLRQAASSPEAVAAVQAIGALVPQEADAAVPVTPQPASMPPSSVMQAVAAASYDSTPASTVQGWTLVSHTPTLCFYENEAEKGSIIVGVRGTVPTDLTDVRADVAIPTGGLGSTVRFKADDAELRRFQKEKPQASYAYFGAGHSLGGAVIDLLLKRGLLTSAISYNPAVCLIQSDTGRNHRIYNASDPLYALMGQYTKNPEVRGTRGPTTLAAHDLTQFMGGRR